MKKLLTLSVFLLLCPIATGVAGTREEIVRLQSDVLQLQELIRTLQKALDENNGVIVSLLEQLNDQVAGQKLVFEDLKGSVISVKAQTAAVEGSVGQLREELQLLGTKLDEANNRVASLHRKLEENQVQIQTLRSVPGEPGVEVEPDRVYSATFNDYLMGNYALAVDGFQNFLADYPESEYADNAAYYLGDCFLRQGRQEEAVQAFDQVINMYPKGDKAAVAYYKKAMALQDLQRMDEAIATLKKLKRLFRDAPEAKLAEEELERLGSP